MLTYTAKGFTGQYADSVTGLDYYNARYYDPVAGVFLSADTVQGNMQGMNPYGYVGGNPETRNDPTGKYYAPPGGPSGPTPPPPCNQSNNFCGTGNGNNSGGGNSGSGGTKPPQKKTQVNLGGCDAACAARDLQLIQDHQSLVTQLVTDASSAVMYLLAAIADLGLEQYASLLADLFSLGTQIFAVVKDALDLNGGAPTWMTVAAHFVQYITGALNVARGFMGFFGGISGLLNSFSFAKGVFEMAKTEFSSYMQTAIAGIVGGGAEFYSGYTGLQTDNLSSLTPQDLHNTCLNEHLEGC